MVVKMIIMGAVCFIVGLMLRRDAYSRSQY